MSASTTTASPPPHRKDHNDHPPPSTSTSTSTTTISTQSSHISRTRQNLTYLLYGPAAGSSAVPSSFRTRSILRTTRYVLKFIFWRLVRYLKYAVVGAAITAIGGGLLGTLTSATAFFVAPSAVAGIGIGIGVGVVKFGWRHRPRMLRGLHLPFTGSTSAAASASASASVSTSTSTSAASKSTNTTGAEWESHSSFWEWATRRASSGADAREDERKDTHDVEGGLQREAEMMMRRRRENRSVREDVWMRV